MLFPNLGPSSLPVVVAQPDERRANRTASVLEWYDKTEHIVQYMVKMKQRYFGHMIIRAILLNILLLRKVKDKKDKGRQRILWMDNVKDRMKIKKVEKLLKMTRNREIFCVMVNFNPLGGSDPD